LAAEDWWAARVVPLELPDITTTAERLLAQQTLAAAPKVAWGSTPTRAGREAT
jgi:hypothetical protein